MSARLLAPLAPLLLAVGCGGSDTARTPSAGGTTPTAPVVRGADHDARDAEAVVPEPQGTEPDKGSPGAQEATGGKVDVPIRERRFTQEEMTVGRGQIVVFTNDDDVPHTVRNERGGLPRSGAIPVGGRFEFTPLKTGRVRYRCSIHPQMRAVLVVRD